MRDGSGADVENAADDVQAARTGVTDEAEYVQQVAGVVFVNFAFHGKTEEEHKAHSQQQQQAAAPFFLEEVACAGKNPAGNRGNHGHTGHGWSSRLGLHIRCGSFSFLHLYEDQFALNFASDISGATSRQDIDFTAYSELARQVNAGFNGEAGIGNDLAFILGFQIVHIGPVSMHVLTDGVPGAVGEVFAKAGRGNVSASRFVHFPAGNFAPGGESFLDLFDSCIAGVADNIEDFYLLV